MARETSKYVLSLPSTIAVTWLKGEESQSVPQVHEVPDSSSTIVMAYSEKVVAVWFPESQATSKIGT